MDGGLSTKSFELRQRTSASGHRRARIQAPDASTFPDAQVSEGLRADPRLVGFSSYDT